MHRPIPETTLLILLRQCYRSPRCLSASTARSSAGHLLKRALSTLPLQRPRSEPLDHHNASPSRAFATTASKLNNEPNNIAVLGAGITGLTTAYSLSRRLPNAKITVYEAADRVGGWMRSERIDVADGSIIFEKGPRTLRPHTPAGMATLALIKDLGLEDEILITPKTSAAARNRFIYYPDHLVKMPGPGQDLYEILWALLTEPLFKGIFRAVFQEHGVPKRSEAVFDESIGHFLERRLGNRFVGENIVGAVLHGIYAGDLYKLSMRSLLPVLWAMEGAYGSLVSAIIGKPDESMGPARIAKMFTDEEDMALAQGLLQTTGKMARWEEMKDASVYTFPNGMQTLSDALAKTLRTSRNVQIKLGTDVTGISYDEKSAGVMIATKTNQPGTPYSHVVSTLPADILSEPLQLGPRPKNKRLIPYTTVMVVNLYYASPSVLPVSGFGYLIPSSLPYAQNPEFALGVIFDSETTRGQDVLSPAAAARGGAIGTKVTVMLGGHYWEGRDHDTFPSEEEAIVMAQQVLARHLRVTETPETARAALQEECIPQYLVEHDRRLNGIHCDLQKFFKGRLAVAGNWTKGVGVNDCILGAERVAELVGRGGGTGLEWTQKPRMGMLKSQ